MSRPLGSDGKPIATPQEAAELLKMALPAIKEFWVDMLFKFRRRAYKGHWRVSGPHTAPEAFRRLQEETTELLAALASEDTDAIRSEAADIGNIAVMIHDLAFEWVEYRKDRLRDYQQGHITEDELMRAINPVVQAPKVPVAQSA